jgi:hypothetical protein
MTRIIGPTGSKRRRRFALIAPLVVLAALALAIGASAGPVGNNSGFEDDDGNLVVNSTFDWNGFSRVSWQPSPSTTPTRQADKVASGWTFKGLEDWDSTTADSGFAGGTKQDQNCPTVITAKAPNKDDLKRVYLSTKTVAVGGVDHVFLNLAWVRIQQNTTSPSAHIGFEFNKGTGPACPPGSNSDGLVSRVAGDMLIVYDFEGGSTELPTLTLRRWTTTPGDACDVSSDSPPCWGVATNLTAGGFAEGRVNTSAVGPVLDQLAPPALTSTTGTSVDATLGLNEFGEAGIDLTAAGVFSPGTCESFGKAYAVSRSSGNSGQAQMKDLVGPANFQLNNCGSIRIIKQTDPRGIDQNFGFTSTIAGSQLQCSQTGTTSPATPFTLNDAGNAGKTLGSKLDADNSAGNTQNCANVPTGTYTVTEGADPGGFSFESLTCSVDAGTPTFSTSGKVATITITKGGDALTCIYINQQQLGAIQVTKTRKHAADGPGDHPHAGVSFTVNGVTKQTDANGVACFDGLNFGAYTVHETVPAGYHVDANDKQVTVDNNAKCSDVPYVGETVSFHNTPLTDIGVTVNSQVDGGTASTVSCTPAGPSGSTDANGDFSQTTTDLEPGTYTCTIVVDP